MAYKVIIINLPKIINFRSVSLSSVAEGVAEGVAMPLPVGQIIICLGNSIKGSLPVEFYYVFLHSITEEAISLTRP